MLPWLSQTDTRDGDDAGEGCRGGIERVLRETDAVEVETIEVDVEKGRSSAPRRSGRGEPF